MPGKAIIRGSLDSGNNRRAEGYSSSCIAGTRGSLRPICQGCLDRLDYDVRGVIGSSAVDVDGVAWKGCSVLLAEGHYILILANGRIYYSNRTNARATA